MILASRRAIIAPRPSIMPRPLGGNRHGNGSGIGHAQAGDVLIQRGTIHNWVNRGTVPCVIAFILIQAKPIRPGEAATH